MSQYQPPPPSPFQPPSNLPPYAYAAYPPPRPGVVGALAITGLILGSLGLICNGIGLIVQLFMIALGKNPFGSNTPVIHDPMINGFNTINAGVFFLLSASLLWISIAALSLKPAAHTAAMRWSLITITWVTLATIVQIIWVLPATADFVLKNQPRNMPPGMAESIRTLQTIGAVIWWLICCTLPVLFLLLWRSPRVLAALGKAPAGGADPMNPGPG